VVASLGERFSFSDEIKILTYLLRSKRSERYEYILFVMQV